MKLYFINYNNKFKLLINFQKNNKKNYLRLRRIRFRNSIILKVTYFPNITIIMIVKYI